MIVAGVARTAVDTARITAQLSLLAAALGLPKRAIDHTDEFEIVVTGYQLRALVTVLLRNATRTDPLRETLRAAIEEAGLP